MSDIYSLSTVMLAHGLQISGSSGIFLLLVMALFVFGPLLFKKFFRMPKGLFISSFISYVLVLINILYFSFDLCVPKIIGYPCLAVVFPSFYVVRFIEDLAEWQWVISNQEVVLFFVAFIINALAIFAIIRLFLYIRPSQKPQVKQGAA